MSEYDRQTTDATRSKSVWGFEEVNSEGKQEYSKVNNSERNNSLFPGFFSHFVILAEYYNFIIIYFVPMSRGVVVFVLFYSLLIDKWIKKC